VPALSHRFQSLPLLHRRPMVLRLLGLRSNW
jgi:hypothetical protein